MQHAPNVTSPNIVLLSAFGSRRGVRVDLGSADHLRPWTVGTNREKMSAKAVA